jgi:ribosomal protein S18 acetylase RimI-like enzyme
MSAMAPAALRSMDLAVDVPAVVELIAAVSTHDKVPYFPTDASLANDWRRTSTFDPNRDVAVLEVDGRLIGLARHSWRERPAVVNHRLELWTHPDHRRQGHGTRLLEWAEGRARQSFADGEDGPAGKPRQFGGAGADDVPAAEAFAAARGYTPYRYHFEMRRPLNEPIPEVSLPEGLDLRPVTPDHHRAIWDADAEAFRDHWDHAEPVDGDFERFFGDPDIDTTLWQVGWDGDEVAGLVINTIYAHENQAEGVQVGWLDSLAGALIARSMAVLRERGMETAGLGVDAENPTGALALYESFGFRPIRRYIFYRKPF